MENNNKILYFHGLSFDEVEKIYNYGKDLDVCILIFTLDHCFIFHKDEDEIERKKAQKAPYTVVENDDISFLKNEKIAKILFMKKDMARLKNIHEMMKDDFDTIDFTFSSNRYLEMNPKGISKGAGIKWLSEYLGIDISETIAIGDNYNDVSMIKEAGVGCCVKSSHQDIKDISDYVCEKDYFEGSVQEVIERFIGE